MKAIDVFYLESEDVSSVVVPRTKKFKIGDKIMDKNGTVYEVHSFEYMSYFQRYNWSSSPWKV